MSRAGSFFKSGKWADPIKRADPNTDHNKYVSTYIREKFGRSQSNFLYIKYI